MESCILQVSCKVSEARIFTLPLQETRSIHDSMNIFRASLFHEHFKILIYYLYLHFIINILYIEIIYNLRNKTVLYLICNHININSLIGVQKGKAEQPV